MRLHSELTINGKKYPKGSEISPLMIYPFFLVHMLAFGGSGFFMAYSSDGPGLGFLYMHGGFAILVYLVFYLAMFGPDKVRWMFINAALGLFGIYAQIDWILARFGKSAADFSVAVHVVPFGYYILYTFLLHQFVLDLTGARDDERRKRRVDTAYVVGSLLVYGTIWVLR